jgi:hypothetical protein
MSVVVNRAERYVRLTARLDTLRSTMATDTRAMRTAVEVRADHGELAQLLGQAVSEAFAAESVEAAMPSGMSSWVAEGLARSTERELALLAATDVIGVSQVLTANPPRWGSSGG